MVSIFLGGLAGGIVRGLVGFMKYQLAYKNVKFDICYFLSIVLISGAVGAVVSWAAKEGQFLGIELNAGIAMVIGYAGGDFIENIYKIITQKSNIFAASK
jgi:hypothetical protein